MGTVQADAGPKGSVVVSSFTTCSEILGADNGTFTDRWRQLASEDPFATPFQVPDWCLVWFEAYSHEYSPLVIAVHEGPRLVGVAPMTVDRSGRLAFAGDSMADYRDVVAATRADRELVIREMLALYGRMGMRETLAVGPTQPGSPTADMVSEAARSVAGVLGTTRRSDPCWRYRIDDPAEAAKVLRRKSLRWALNHYRKQGGLRLDRICEDGDWQGVRQLFFDHHSLRQLRADRVVQFDDPAKRRVHDSLVRDAGSLVDFRVLYAGSRPIAEHFGFYWGGVLYLAAPTFDIFEEPYSPGLLMLGHLIEAAAQAGMRSVDFTSGTEPYKERFGNEKVELPSVLVFRNRLALFRRITTDSTIRVMRRSAERWGGRNGWERLKRRMSNLSPNGLSSSSLAARKWLYSRKSWEFFQVPAAWRLRGEAPRVDPGGLVIRRDHASDLLTGPDTAEIRDLVRDAPKLRRSGWSLWTWSDQGRLAGFAWLRPVGESERCADPAVAVIDEFHWLLDDSPQDHVLVQLLGTVSGSTDGPVVIRVTRGNTMLRAALRRAGLQVVAMETTSSTFGRKQYECTASPSR